MNESCRSLVLPKPANTTRCALPTMGGLGSRGIRKPSSRRINKDPSITSLHHTPRVSGEAAGWKTLLPDLFLSYLDTKRPKEKKNVSTHRQCFLECPSITMSIIAFTPGKKYVTDDNKNTYNNVHCICSDQHSHIHTSFLLCTATLVIHYMRKELSFY